MKIQNISYYVLLLLCFNSCNNLKNKEYYSSSQLSNPLSGEVDIKLNKDISFFDKDGSVKLLFDLICDSVTTIVYISNNACFSCIEQNYSSFVELKMMNKEDFIVVCHISIYKSIYQINHFLDCSNGVYYFMEDPFKELLDDRIFVNISINNKFEIYSISNL